MMTIAYGLGCVVLGAIFHEPILGFKGRAQRGLQALMREFNK